MFSFFTLHSRSHVALCGHCYRFAAPPTSRWSGAAVFLVLSPLRLILCFGLLTHLLAHLVSASHSARFNAHDLAVCLPSVLTTDLSFCLWSHVQHSFGHAISANSLSSLSLLPFHHTAITMALNSDLQMLRDRLLAYSLPRYDRNSVEWRLGQPPKQHPPMAQLAVWYVWPSFHNALSLIMPCVWVNRPLYLLIGPRGPMSMGSCLLCKRTTS